MQVYPVVHSGTVVVLKTGFGFLETGDADARNRVYFAASEVSPFLLLVHMRSQCSLRARMTCQSASIVRSSPGADRLLVAQRRFTITEAAVRWEASWVPLIGGNRMKLCVNICIASPLQGKL